MIADQTVFGYMTQKAANEELKMNLSIVKQQAETLLHEMDLLIDRCRFEPGEGQKCLESSGKFRKLNYTF